MTSQLKALSMKIATMQTTSEIAGALKGATSTMSEVNKTMDIKDIQNVLKEFSKESQKLELGQEAVSIQYNTHSHYHYLSYPILSYHILSYPIIHSSCNLVFYRWEMPLKWLEMLMRLMLIKCMIRS